MDQAEINYDVHDKKLLTIVAALKEWRYYLEGAHHQIQIYTDHKNLEYYTTIKIFHRRQARWAQELAGYNLKIFYRPGNANGKPDALSRHSEYRSKRGEVALKEMKFNLTTKSSNLTNLCQLGETMFGHQQQELGTDQ